MTSSALPSRKRAAVCAAVSWVAIVIVALSTSWAGAQVTEETAGPETVAVTRPPSRITSGNPFAGRFPNVVLKTHEGKNVRFYDDLLKDKIVLINFFYVTCEER